MWVCSFKVVLQSLGVHFPVEFLYELHCFIQNNDIPVKIGKTVQICVG